MILIFLATPALLVASGLVTAVLIGAEATLDMLLVLSWSLLQLPLLIWAACRHRRLQRRTAALPTLELVDELGQCVSHAEAALRRDEELLHELRATVVGIAMAHRLLHEDLGQLHLATRQRLEQLTDSELARLERLVAAEPGQVIDGINLEAIIAPLVDSVRLRGHVVSLECSSPDVRGRPDDIAEVVHILLENAVRHAPGCDIRVVLRGTEDAVLVQVTDQGPGISSEVAPTLFRRGARTPQSPGRGLGLHIARSLAREMGGSLVWEPTSRGASFTLTLPTVDEEASCLGHSA